MQKTLMFVLFTLVFSAFLPTNAQAQRNYLAETLDRNTQMVNGLAARAQYELARGRAENGYGRYNNGYSGGRRYGCDSRRRIGFGISIVVDRHQRNYDERYREDDRQRELNDRPERSARQQEYDEAVAREGELRRSGRTSEPLAGPRSADRNGNNIFDLTNASDRYVEVYDGDTWLGRMAPRDKWQVPAPQNQYHGYAVIPNKRGGLNNDATDIQPSTTGWVFTKPAYVGR